MYTGYYRVPVNLAADAPTQRLFSEADFKRAGFPSPMLSGMPILEAHQTINRMNMQEAARKAGPRYLYHL